MFLVVYGKQPKLALTTLHRFNCTGTVEYSFCQSELKWNEFDFVRNSGTIPELA